jgi:hypothetical protein
MAGGSVDFVFASSGAMTATKFSVTIRLIKADNHLRRKKKCIGAKIEKEAKPRRDASGKPI